MGTHSFVLADVNNLSQIFSPLKSTHRIKYTCFNVSQNFLILGATSGALYVFKRDPCSFLQLLPNKEGAITRVAISPDEKLFAFSTLKGVVCVLERNVGPGARRVQMSSEHQGADVTALHWNGQSNELYIGDDTGKVSVINISGFVAKNMFNTPSFQLMQLDSRIVQLDWQSDLLLVSTLTRSYLCDTVKEQYRQIGHKLREGEYGGCFYISGDHTLPVLTQQKAEIRGGSFISLNEGEKLRDYEGLQNLKMFCARPGSRLWEVQVDGTVLRTHQFKQALAVQPTALVNLQESSNSSQQSDNHATNSTNNAKSDMSWNQQSFNFFNLLLLGNIYLFTFKKDGIYIFDPEKASVVLWNNEIVDIVDAQTQNDMIYVWTASGSMHALMFSSLEKFLIRLYLRKQYMLCAQLCEQHNKYLMEEAPTLTKLHLLADLGTKLSNDEVAERILPLLQEISKYAQETKNAQRLDSGIFVVGNQHFLWQTENKPSGPVLPETKRADRFKDKCRSLSVSPETTRRKKKSEKRGNMMISQNSESSSSLPELGKLTVTESTENSRTSSTIGDTSTDIDVKLNNNNTTDPSFTSASSPEALQALKELGQSVSSKISSSTKSLKEKWQVFEGKILGHETPPEPLDVRTAEYRDNAAREYNIHKDENELVYSERPKNYILCRDLDLMNVTKHCKQISKCTTDDVEEMNQMTYKLFDSILYMYEDFVFALDKRVKHLDSLEQTEMVDVVKSSTESMASFLTTWCEKPFPFQNYFSKDDIKVICDRLHKSLKSKVLILWLQNKVNAVESNVQFVEQFYDLYPLDILNLDVLLSRLLIVCSDLLDPHSILQCIMESTVPCYYLSFCTVLDKYQEGALQFVTGDSAVDSTCWKWPMPLLLNAMFFMLKMGQIETCCMMGNNICLKNVYYLVVRLQEYLISSGEDQYKVKKRCYSLFLSYLDKMSECNSAVMTALQDEQLALFITMAFECVNENLGESCKCGFPLPLPRTTLPQFSKIGEMISLYYWQTNHDRHMELCRRAPFMWRHVLTHRRTEDVGLVLPLVIQLGDMSELEKWLPDMTQTLWERTLGLVTSIRSGKCLNCGAYCVSGELCGCISLSAVGTLMIKSLGPQAVVDLLMKYMADNKPGELNARFFQSCIFAAIVDSHATGLRSEVVDMLNDDARTSTKKTALFSAEMGKTVAETLLQDLGKVSAPPKLSKSHHWGVCVDLGGGSCPCCALPLNSEVLVRDGGLTVFQCGHSYHAVCLRQRQCHACLICSKGS